MKTTAIIIGAALLSGCLPESDQIANQQQEALSLRAVESVGMPAITKFSEKRALKSILELRDKEVATWTYTQDMEGRFHFLCNSIGYGIPYATQYTNPMRKVYEIALPQSDPNGLFSAGGAEGTWILCLNQETKLASPLYVEPRVIVSPFRMGIESNPKKQREGR